MFIIQVNKSEVKVLSTEKLYTFAKNIYKLHVVWSNDWNGLNKMAHFYVGDVKYDIDMTYRDEVCIPWELFADKCSVGKNLTVSFEGKWKNHIVIPTPVTNLGVIRRSDTENANNYIPPAPPTPDIYQQLREELESKADDASFDKETRTFRLWAEKEVIAEFEIPGGEGGSSVNLNDATAMFGKKAEAPVASDEPVTMLLNDFIGTTPQVGQTYKAWISDGEALYTCVLQILEVNQDTGFVKCRILSVMPLTKTGGSDSIDTYSKQEIDKKFSEIELTPGPPGKDGKSAYVIALQEGFDGSEAEWLESLTGQNGSDGFSPTVNIEEIDGGHRISITDENGEQSFDVMNGIDATATDISDSTLFVAKFDDPPQAGNQIYTLPESNIIGKTPNFDSTYIALIGDSKELYWCQVVLNHINGAVGSVGIRITSVSSLTVDAYSKAEIDQMFSEIESGTDGESAYDIAVRNGFEGTEEEWLDSLKGNEGSSGKSAYEIAVENGFVGTEEEWLESLQGQNGATFTPSVSEFGILSWSNNGNLPNPDPVDIKGPPSPAGSGSDLIFDDGFTQDGDIISVTTPVRGIYTQEEFDAMPEAQRNKGMYVVDDGESGGGTSSGSGGGTSQDIYSTEETRIGTWIDGKPLYRAVFQAVLPTGMLQWVSITGVYLNNLDTLVSLIGNIKNTKGGEPAQRSINDLTCQIAILENNQIGIYTGNDWYHNQPVIIIAEYTKTTDSEVSA